MDKKYLIIILPIVIVGGILIYYLYNQNTEKDKLLQDNAKQEQAQKEEADKLTGKKELEIKLDELNQKIKVKKSEVDSYTDSAKKLIDRLNAGDYYGDEYSDLRQESRSYLQKAEAAASELGSLEAEGNSAQKKLESGIY